MPHLLQNTPIACYTCGTKVYGREENIRRGTEIHTECRWRCNRCGTYLKQGTLRITPIQQQNENK
jgi:hypothetical protein